MVDQTGLRLRYRRQSDRIGAHSGWPDQEAANSKTLSSLGLDPSRSSVVCYLRPLRGDHIHYAVSIQVHGKLVDTFWDADFLGAPFSSEGKRYPVNFANLTEGMHDYHIAQTKPHFGIHSGHAFWFGDGFVHEHPGTSWGWFHATEGMGATLSAYLEQVGVAFHEGSSARYPIGQMHVPGAMLNGTAMTFPDTNGGQPTMVGGEYDCAAIQENGVKGQNRGDGRIPLRSFENVQHSPMELSESDILIASNATHTWRAYYYSYWNQTKPTEILEEGINDIWLKENLGLITLSFEPRELPEDSSSFPRPPACMIDVLSDKRRRDGLPPTPHQQSSFYTLGFDSLPYPMPNGDSEPYRENKPEWLQSVLSNLEAIRKTML
uniref:Uncharacterized protein n=1 Tax=Chromera velia CCMP2878 TaxID=1169474 RepID=A0A0G4IA56_9ALVE|eukprot:Cvel_12438.t1-p1 / transcript=Cvel_12438.t1 / gene=Cvel_12438 / organism=Chromera_velia_CCMP2878 / gene_product=hypothetical protein / transcript_product=hypothetical protein / location=Cvel_scaffold814:42232-43359(+) / protein_length=376 / sequence_SO=supercontig / SO=protein_coding / is_pseudo=false